MDSTQPIKHGWSFQDLTGKVFGQLTVISWHGRIKLASHWLCECSCGKRTIVRGQTLQDGRTKSCGSHRRKYQLNESAFDDADSNPIAQYWLGMLMGDGCVMVRKSGDALLQLDLQLPDRGHVESFAAFLGTSQPLSVDMHRGFANSQGSVRIRVCSKRLCAAVAVYGVVPRKSFIAKVIHLESSLHFWRGYVDANGSVYFTKQRGDPYPHVGVSGSRSITEQFAAFVHSLIGVKMSIHPNGSVWSTGTTGTRAVALVHNLYIPGSVSLLRKRLMAEQIAVWKGKRR